MIQPHLPERFAESIERYVSEGVPVGGFLQAVLSNDLREAFARADYRSVRELPGLVSWLYNHAPYTCWGSYERVAAWADAGGERGIYESAKAEREATRDSR